MAWFRVTTRQRLQKLLALLRFTDNQLLIGMLFAKEVREWEFVLESGALPLRRRK